MSLSERLEDLSPPVLYYPVLRPIAGTANATIFLSECIVWSEESADGWFYQSQDQWLDRTGLRKNEQDTARRSLRAAGLIEERKVGHVLQYRAVLENIRSALGE